MSLIAGRTGNILNVVSKGRLPVQASGESEFAASSWIDGDAYCWATATADIAATETAILLCNNSTTKHLHIVKAYMYSDVPTQLQWHFPAYPTLAGTAITGVNLNRTSKNVAPASCYADETGNTQANIFMTVSTNEVTGDQRGLWLDFESAIILYYHDCIAMDVVADGAAFEAAIFGYFHTHD